MWTVKEGEPSVDQRKLVVTVPAGEERRHERLKMLAKVRVSPETPEWARKVASQKALDVAEDVRAAQIVEQTVNVPRPRCSERDVQAIKEAVRKGDQQEAARLTLTTLDGRHYVSGAYQELRRDEYRKDEAAGEAASHPRFEAVHAEQKDFGKFIDGVDRMLDPSDYRTSVAAAHMIDELDTIRQPGRRGGKDEPQSYEDLVDQSNDFGGDHGLSDLMGGGGDPVGEAIKKAKEAVNEAMTGTPGWGPTDGDGTGAGTPFEGDADEYHTDEEAEWDECGWPEPTWLKPPLVRNLLLRKSARSKRPTDEGAVIRHMDRWFTDRRVFDRKRKVPGGTLVIDTSGSMSLTSEQIDEIIAVSPMATIVLYSGRRGVGYIKLVAKAGKRCVDDEMECPGGGNEVDGPALKWLAKQQEPRVWVSDGMACSSRQESDYACINWCRKFAKKNRIVRMPDADTAIDLLKRMW